MKHLITKTGRGLLLAAVMAVSALAGAPAAQAASPVYIVDNDVSTACAPTYNGSMPNPLQSAITDAITNGVKTILVCPGPYTGPYTITNAGTLTIKRQDPSYMSVVLNAPATNNDAVITVTNSSKVTLDGLAVDGTAFDDAAGGTMRGIIYESSGGTIMNSAIKNIADPTLGSASGVGIQLIDIDGNSTKPSVVIRNNVIARFETSGIAVYGTVRATISGNHVDGANGDTTHGMPTAGIALIGIGTAIPSGTISMNMVYFSKIGALVGNAGKVSITGNFIDGSATSNIELYASCDMSGMLTNSNKVSGNTLIGPGIDIIAEEIDGQTNCDPTASMNTIATNTISSPTLDGTTAVRVMAIDNGLTTYLPKVDKNKITSNTFWGFQQGVKVSGSPLPTGTVDSKNILMHR